ncbi:hypothetical protein Bca101_082721 [Brassica carinata]
MPFFFFTEVQPPPLLNSPLLAWSLVGSVDPPPFTTMHHRIRLSCCEWSHPCPCWCCVAEPRHGRDDQRGAAASFPKPAVFFICDPPERTVQFGAEIHRYGSKPRLKEILLVSCIASFEP